MSKKAIESWVGLFVIISFGALLVLALQVSELTNFIDPKVGYTVKAVFKNIGGLKERAKVTIGGVAIGRVIKVELKQNKVNEYEPVVHMKIYSTVNQIPVDSVAKILTAGLLGDNYVGIELGNDTAFLQDGSYINLTTQALLLEDLISKFAVGGNK